MRTLDAATLALLEAGTYDDHHKVLVANGSGTLIDLSGRLTAGSWVQSGPSQPIASVVFEFLRELNDDITTSLSPFIGASTLNRLDDGTTFSELLQMGRLVVYSVALTAIDGDRPADDSTLWYEVFRGLIDDDGSGGRYGNAVITCSDRAGRWNVESSEAEYTYAAGTSIEAAVQAVLDNKYGSSTYTVSTPTATGSVLSNIYGPGRQKKIWEQVWELPQSIGWVGWWRYSAAATSSYTLFEPDRDKTVSDFTLPVVRDLTQLNVSARELANVLYGEFSDADGARQLVGPIEDTVSIAKYGGVRRVGTISLPEDSPVRSESDMTALLNAALSDTADPDAIATAEVPFFPFAEVAADLLTFTANDIHFDTDQKLAPFAITHQFAAGAQSKTVMQLRGKPSAGKRTWPIDRTPVVSEPVAVYALDLKEIGRAPDDSTATFDGPWGAKIDEVRVFEALVAQPYSEDSWPAITGDPAQGPFTSRVPIVFDVPPQGYVRLVRVVGILEDGTPGAIERFTILPTGTEPDLVTALSVLVNDADGSATIRVDIADRASSIRYAYDRANPAPAWSSDATVEAGTVLAVTGSATISLPAGTVDYLETLRFRVAAYTGAAGTGYDGATDHGPIVGGEDIRLPSDVTLEQTTASEAGGVGTFGATLHDAAGLCTQIEKFTRSGAGAWVGPILITGTPANGTEYTATVSLQEDHQSQVKIRATYTKNGSAGYVEAVSPGFDAGQIPDIKIVPYLDESARTASASVPGDFDTASVKIVASTAGEPSAATVRAATAINGRNLTVADVGTLVSSLSPGDVVDIAAFGYSGAGGTGNESSKIARARITVGVLPALLEATTESESGTTGTFGVTVRDPSGVATGLYYRTKSGSGAWSARTLVTGTPAHGTEYQQTVTLEEDHLSFIRFELDFTVLGAAKTFVLASSGFDKGKIPNITIVPVIDETARTASAAVSGDFDTASVKIAASTSGVPSAATVRAATAVNGRDITAATIGALVSSLTAGQTVYFAAYGYSATGGGGNESTSLAVAKVVVGVVAPLLEVSSESETSTTGTFAVILRDPSGIATAIYYRTKSGSGAWGSWTLKTGTPSNGTTYTETVTLVEDHLSFIEFRVDYSLLGLAKSLSLKSSGFDKGKVPDLSLVPRISETGAVSCEIQGDFDTASAKIAASTSAYPSDATVRAATAIDGRIIPAATVGTLATLTVGQTLYIKAFGYSAASGGGNESSAAVTATITRGAAYTPKVKADFTRSGTTATLALTIEDLLKKVTTVEWSTQTQGGSATSFSATFSSSTGTAGTDATLTRSQTFTVSDGTDLAVRYRITFTDENGASKVISDTLAVANLASVTKSIRVPFTGLVPSLNTGTWNYTSASLHPNDVSNQTYRGTTLIPKGATITNFSARLNRAAVADFALAFLNRVSDTPSSTTIASVQHATTGWATLSASLSQLVGDEAYVWGVQLIPTNLSTDAAVAWVELTYTVPNYSATY